MRPAWDAAKEIQGVVSRIWPLSTACDYSFSNIVNAYLIVVT
jgi:hypothetical protein